MTSINYDIPENPLHFGGNTNCHTMPKSKFSNENVKKLVDLVRQRPLLYDPACQDHKDAQMMHNSWESISRVMKIDGMNGEYICAHLDPYILSTAG